MQSALDRNTLDRLIAVGRKQGHLTTEDLRTGLPVESMSAEEIALIVAHLEETGVPVELEDRLIFPEPNPRPVPPGGAQIIPFPAERSVRARSLTKPAPLKVAPPSFEPLPSELQPKSGTHWIAAVVGLFVFALLVCLGVALSI
ncbi:RNA polymerase sigma factor region1.1 domain-containing protein [Microvirga roseola]|uniref:RNA polymerase sigma factor region1.1 domain-containing protein n=1 Tax=Microvirga roseola TaxID=2883126 RepID=UPI001E2AA904|nr:RNA polymerase sigma factor region1.1 domain-containing protein [Microvirga roseola]